MKARVCKCAQCRAVRRRQSGTKDVITYQTRAARSRVKEMLKKAPYDLLDDILPEAVPVDYYA